MKRAFIILSILFALTACDNDKTVNSGDNGETIEGSENIIKETRVVSDFSGIHIISKAKVYIKNNSTSDALVIESNDNIMPKVQTTVNNELLTVSLEDGSYSNLVLNVYANLENVSRLSAKGQATFYTSDSIATDNLIIDVEGQAEYNLYGRAVNQYINIEGQATVNNFGLLTNYTDIHIIGQGVCNIYSSDRLDVLIEGEGTVVYDGSPDTLNQTITGVGTISARN